MMCDQDDLDINSLRHEHESPTEWKLRQRFLEAHRDKLPLDSLLCLSTCFINVEMMGCRYPDPVMERLRGLADVIKDDVESHRKRIKAKTEVKFVKATDDSTPGTSRTGAAITSITQSQQGTNKAISFVKSNDSFKSTDLATTNQDGTAAKVATVQKAMLDRKFFNYQKQVHESICMYGTENASSVLHMAAQKAPMTVTFKYSQRGDQMHVAKVLLDFVLVSEEAALTRKIAEKLAYGAALGVLCKTYLRIVALSPDEYKMEGSDEPFRDEETRRQNFSEPLPSFATQQHDRPQYEIPGNCGNFAQRNFGQHGMKSDGPPPGQRRRYTSSGANFLLYESQNTCNEASAISILKMSCDFSNMAIELDTVMKGASVCGKVTIQNVITVEADGPNVKDAKTAVAEKALNELRKKFFTIQIKKRNDESEGVRKEELLGDGSEKALPDSNVGNKLLRMMGWTGGGVGKAGQGIAEPVSLDSVLNRQGLGLANDAGISHKFRKKVRSKLLDYARSNEQKDLVFSPDFTEEERNIIRMEGQKFKLKAASFKKKLENGAKARYMVVSRKRNTNQLFQHLMDNNGETEGYVLVKPGEQIPANQGNSAQQQNFSQHRLQSDGPPHGQRGYPSSGANFLLYETQDKYCGANAVSILKMSCDFSNVAIEYDTVMKGASVCGRVTIQKVITVEADGPNVEDAKTAVAEKALNELRNRFFTIQIKKQNDETEGVRKEELLGDGSEKALPDSNVGNKWRRIMGWTGGVGRAEQGITEPVSLDLVINRQDLGLAAEAGLSHQFRNKVESMILDYAQANEQKDLLFSPEFTPEERKIIHKEGHKFKLKTKSFDKTLEDGTKERQLVVSRKINKDQLFQHLMDYISGETERYVLVKPGEHEDLIQT